MPPLLATELPLPSPEAVAGGISKQGLYYIIGLLCAVVAFLFWRMMADRDAFQKQHNEVQQLRISDRDKFQDRLETLAKEMHATVAENGKAFWATQRELMRLEPKAGRSARGAPALGPEPVSQAGLPPGKP